MFRTHLKKRQTHYVKIYRGFPVCCEFLSPDCHEISELVNNARFMQHLEQKNQGLLRLEWRYCYPTRYSTIKAEETINKPRHTTPTTASNKLIMICRTHSMCHCTLFSRLKFYLTIVTKKVDICRNTTTHVRKFDSYSAPPHWNPTSVIATVSKMQPQ